LCLNEEVEGEWRNAIELIHHKAECNDHKHHLTHLNSKMVIKVYKRDLGMRWVYP